MRKIDPVADVQRVFEALDGETFALPAREGSTLEFKVGFDWESRAKYAKTIAAFANNRGGYMIFGVSDSPRQVVGLSNKAFDNLDEATITAYLNSALSPEIRYSKFAFDIHGKHVGVLYTYSGREKPVIAIKNDRDIKEAEIYYRYNARNDKIKYPELKRLFEQAQEVERQKWMELFRRVSKVGPVNAGIMDVTKGTIEGQNRSLLIDESLVPKLKFIKEGELAARGKPVLKLVGDVRPIAATNVFKSPPGVRLTSDPAAPTVREEDILENFPLAYSDLLALLQKRYSNFSVTKKFHKLKRALQHNHQLCRTRLLDPSKPNGTSKVFYSRAIISEFDKHYSARNVQHGTKKRGDASSQPTSSHHTH